MQEYRFFWSILENKKGKLREGFWCERIEFFVITNCADIKFIDFEFLALKIEQLLV